MTRAPRLLLTMILLGLAATAKHTVPQSQERTPAMIRGDDDRQETVDVQDPRIRAMADSVPALVSKSRLFVPILARRGVDPQFKIFEEDGHRICPEERFARQPRFAKCSGALVAPDLVLTAGHCVERRMDCLDTHVVFGYRWRRDQRVEPLRHPEVYTCSEIVARHYDEDGADYALIRLNRPVRNHAPLAVSRDFVMPPQRGMPVMMIGYPSGFPQKVLRGGTVQWAIGRSAFMHTLDSFHAISGAPIFEEQSGEIIGVHARGRGYGEYGDYDLAPGRDCLVPRRCVGECLDSLAEASTIEPLLSLIPESPAASPR